MGRKGVDWDRRTKLVLATMSRGLSVRAAAKVLAWEFSPRGNALATKTLISTVLARAVNVGLVSWARDGNREWKLNILCDREFYAEYLDYTPVVKDPADLPPTRNLYPQSGRYKKLRKLGWSPADITGTGEKEFPEPPPPHVYRPGEDWTPEEFLFWVNSLEGVSPEEAAARLSPDVLAKAKAAAKYLTDAYRRPQHE